MARKLSAQHPVVEWIRAQIPILFMSTVSVVEIERGIEKQRRADPPFANSLEAWLQGTLLTFEGRLLPVTTGIAQRWGRMQFQLGRDDLDVGIAATALEHNPTVVTHNVRHFDKTGAAVLDPFDAVP